MPVGGAAFRRDDPNEPPLSLHEAITGTEFEQPGWGKAFLARRLTRELGSDGERINELFRRSFCASNSPIAHRLRRCCEPPDVQPTDLLFLDLETTGLGNSPVFLIGLMAWEEDGFVVRQYLARDYSEEAAITSAYPTIASSRRLLVTFNGKSFDWPYLRARAIVHGIPFSCELPHFDLLHEARRAWRRHLPDCRLQTLERSICLRTRGFDIPGSEVPEAYHSFVRTGNASRIAIILKHNLLDLLTLAELLVRLPPLEE